VSSGLAVIQGDAETDLFDYPDHAFDYVVLSQTLQAMRAPRTTLGQLLRIGRRAIVSMPNFAHWRLRLSLLIRGQMPKSAVLAENWYDSPNVHLCSVRDFVALCREMSVTIERGLFLGERGRPGRFGHSLTLANVFGEQAVFVLSRDDR
jgi:methionine biosynthesis protein MetW